MSLLVVQSTEDHIDVNCVTNVPDNVMQLVIKRRAIGPLVFDECDEFGAWFLDEATPKILTATTDRKLLPQHTYPVAVDAVVILRMAY